MEIVTHTTRAPEALSPEQAEKIRHAPPRILTLPEAAAYLRHSPRTLRDLTRLRRIPFVNLRGTRGQGSKLLFRLEDLEARMARLSKLAA